MNGVAHIESLSDQLDGLRAALLGALEVGEVEETRRLLDKILATDNSCAVTEEWAQVRDVTAWPDGWLIAAVRRDPPDEQALEALVDRYWKPLFGRCQMLTLNHERASDLAQDAWCRVLRARRSLKPDGNFPAYLATVATNLWRDSQRHSRRAGQLAEHRLASLDAALTDAEGDTLMLADALPDFRVSESAEAARLRLDIDEGLARLVPLLRDVLVARFIAGESCAEIGQRYGRTEQTVSGWVREAVRVMKLHLEDRVGVTS